MYQLSLLFMTFLIFSILGYMAEMFTCFLWEHRWTNRGFLCGPVIPIYGVGSLGLIYLLEPLKHNPILIFIFGMIITTSIEYLTSYLLEKIFHNKWWDYKDHKFNLNGRICLLNSVLFGIGSLIIIYFIGPWIKDFLLEIKDPILITFACIFFCLFVIDVIYSCVVAYSLRNRIIIVEELKNMKLAKIPGMLERLISKQLENLKGIKKFPSRLLKAFPYINFSNQKEFDIMKKLEKKRKEKKKEKKRKAKLKKKKKT